MSPSPNRCGVRGWRRVTFQTAQYPVVICWSVTEAFVAVRVWFSLCCTGLFGWFGAALKTFFLFRCFRETLVVSKVLGGFFFSSETVNYRLMGNCSDGADRKFEVSEQLPSFHRSVLKGTEKRATKNVQLVLQHYCKTSWIPMSRVLPPT